MDINVFYQTMDDLFRQQELAQIDPYLTASLDEAREESDYQAYMAICNEMIGYYRSISEFEKAYRASEDVLLLMEELKLEDTEHFAMVLMNSAQTYNAGGSAQVAYEQYMRALKILEEQYGRDGHTDKQYYLIGALMGVGETCYHLENYEAALAYYEKAAEAVKKHFGENESYAILNENCGAVCDRLGDAEKADFYRRRAGSVRTEEKTSGESTE